MIITALPSLLLLLATFSALSAETLHVTFEIERAGRLGKPMLKEDMKKLEALGFDCYIKDINDSSVLRCNDAKTLEEMENSINRLRANHIEYTIVRLTPPQKETNTTVTAAEQVQKARYAIPFYYGYIALDEGNMKRAMEIFSHYYRLDPNAKHAYGYALALMKQGRYNEAMKVLAPYRGKDKKCTKLYHDTALAYMYALLKRGEYTRAHQTVKRYLGNDRKLHARIDLARIDTLRKKGALKEALTLLHTSPYLSSQERDRQTYAIAAALSAEKKYADSNRLLEPLLSRFPKAENLFVANLKALAGQRLKEGKAQEALALLAPYRRLAPIEAFYQKIRRSESIAEGWRLLHQQKPYQALEAFQRACKDRRSKDCLEGMMQAYYAMGRYAKALAIAEELYRTTKSQDAAKFAFLSASKLGDEATMRRYYPLLKEKKSLPDPFLNDKLIAIDHWIDDGFYPKAYKELRKLHKRYPDHLGILYKLFQVAMRTKRYDEAFDYSKRLLKEGDNAIRSGVWSTIADFYNKRNDKKAVAAYRNAVAYDPENFGIRLAYLYALKKYGEAGAFDREWRAAYRDFPYKRPELTALKRAYRIEQLNDLFQAKEYAACYRLGKELLPDHPGRGTEEQIAWCAFKSDHFKEAQRLFAGINYRYGESTDDVYGFALSAYRAGDEEAALAALSRIESRDNPRYRELVASLYSQMNDARTAKEIALKLAPSPARERAITNINKSFTSPKAEHAIALGFYRDYRTGASGKGEFEVLSVPVTYHYPYRNLLHFYAKGEPMYLTKGSLKDPKGFGFNDTRPDQDQKDDTVFLPAVGIDTRYLQAEIGTTPLGSQIDPLATWLLKAKIGSGPWSLYLQWEQQSVDESMTSFVGTRAYRGDPASEWGRVVRRGYRAGIVYDDVITYLVEVGYFPDIYGKNVIDNSETKGVALAIYHTPVESIDYLDIGVVGVYDQYDKNTLAYTYGHGGYFSPQNFLMGALTVRLGDTIDRFYYQLMGSLGYENYSSDAMWEFPLDETGRTLPGTSDSGVTYKGVAEVGYTVTPHVDIVGGYSVENMYSYTRNRMGLSVVYRFDKRPHPKYNTFNLTHRIEELMQ